jgi:hypothetical protein
LPCIEQWATQRKLLQHHIKSIYRAATSYHKSNTSTGNRIDGSIPYYPTTSELQDLIDGDGNDKAYERSTLQQLLQVGGVPKIIAAALLQQFRLRTLRLHDIQYPSSSTTGSGSIKLIIQLPKANTNSDRYIETVIIRHD